MKLKGAYYHQFFRERKWAVISITFFPFIGMEDKDLDLVIIGSRTDAPIRLEEVVAKLCLTRQYSLAMLSMVVVLAVQVDHTAAHMLPLKPMAISLTGGEVRLTVF